MQRARALPATVAVAGSLLLGACTHDSPSPPPGATPAAGPARGTVGGTLYVLLTDDVDHLDPQRVYTPEAADLSRLYSRTLVTYRPRPGKQGLALVGDLATDLGEASDGARTWTFHLRQGLRFEDGGPVTSADVAYGVARSFDPDLADGPPYARSLLDCGAHYQGPRKSGRCKAIETPDDTTITFHLARPVGDFPYVAALPAFAPVPRARDTGVRYDAAPVATGPYKLSVYQRGRRMELVRNDQWDRATDEVRAALPDRVVVLSGLDQATIDARLSADRGDDRAAVMLGGSVLPVDAARVQQSGDVAKRQVRALTGCTRYLAMNTTHRPLDNVKVRQAVLYAVDKVAYRNAIGGEAVGQFATTTVAPPLLGHRQFDLYRAPPTGDPDRARRMLTEAGHPHGIALTLTATSRGFGVTTSRALRDALARAGIRVTVQSVDPAVYASTIRDPDKVGDLAQLDWCPDWPSAAAVIPPLFAGTVPAPTPNGNVARYQSDDVDERLDRVRATTDRDEAADGWGRLDERVMQDAPVVPLVHDYRVMLHGSAVGNFYLSTAYGGRPDLVSLDVAAGG